MIEKTVNPGRSRLYALLIMVLIFAPMVLAYIMFHTGWGVSGNTTNKGDLLESPLPIADLELNLNEQDKLTRLYQGNDKRWRILVPVDSPCKDPCANFLYLTRQVHIRLAQDAYRVERILLLLDELPHGQIKKLTQEHPNSIIVNSNIDALTQWLQKNDAPKSASGYFYLIDQEGYAMMRYGEQHTGQNLLDDLKKLLKFTYDK
ncbi:MAG: hypothetical protein AAFZ92_03520 [Pseudomonadota bacterium]